MCADQLSASETYANRQAVDRNKNTKRSIHKVATHHATMRKSGDSWRVLKAEPMVNALRIRATIVKLESAHTEALSENGVGSGLSTARTFGIKFLSIVHQSNSQSH